MLPISPMAQTSFFCLRAIGAAATSVLAGVINRIMDGEVVKTFALSVDYFYPIILNDA